MQKLLKSFVFFYFVITQTTIRHTLEKMNGSQETGLRPPVVFGTHGTSFWKKTFVVVLGGDNDYNAFFRLWIVL